MNGYKNMLNQRSSAEWLPCLKGAVRHRRRGGTESPAPAGFRYGSAADPERDG